MLAVDVGNTHITLGAFPERSRREPPAAVGTWRLSTHRHATADEYGLNVRGLLGPAGLRLEGLAGVAVASVVPPLDPVFRELSQKHLGLAAFFVEPGVPAGVRVLCDNPAEVGADRVVNAAAAFARARRACIVADFGTATTFDCVNARGDYLGGAIAPGPQMAAEVLYQRTAKLPLLGAFHRPPRAIGKNTLDSIASGLFHGYVGLTRGLLQGLKREMGGNPTILATGGLAGLLSPSVPEIKEVVPDLTLEGLWRIWVKNRKKK
jgi:type III pantothenate kinase